MELLVWVLGSAALLGGGALLFSSGKLSEWFPNIFPPRPNNSDHGYNDHGRVLGPAQETSITRVQPTSQGNATYRNEYMLEGTRALDSSTGATGDPDDADAQHFDLPRSRPIGYLSYNGMGRTLDRASFSYYRRYQSAFPEWLARCGYNVVCFDNDQRFTELRENPATVIERQIAAMHRQGVRDFYLDFDAHGDRNGTQFTWTDSNNRTQASNMSPEALRSILMRYSDCTFAINTESCHGGGLIDMMRNFRDAPDAPEGRVTLFAHTKEDRCNTGRTYFASMARLLHDMANGVPGAPRTFGEAHYRADRATKRNTLGYVDPEFWRSRPAQPSLRTSHNNASRPDPLAQAAQQYWNGISPATHEDYDGVHHNLPHLIDGQAVNRHC